MTYYEITIKLKDLTMTPSDWSWLDNYLKEKGSHVYSELVNAYQERERGNLPICDTDFGLCHFCSYGFKCTYKGFCGHQRKAR